jgi:hypothetical protein
VPCSCGGKEEGFLSPFGSPRVPQGTCARRTDLRTVHDPQLHAPGIPYERARTRCSEREFLQVSRCGERNRRN